MLPAEVSFYHLPGDVLFYLFITYTRTLLVLETSKSIHELLGEHRKRDLQHRLRRLYYGKAAIGRRIKMWQYVPTGGSGKEPEWKWLQAEIMGVWKDQTCWKHMIRYDPEASAILSGIPATTERWVRGVQILLEERKGTLKWQEP